jgi:hypothetical protein
VVEDATAASTLLPDTVAATGFVVVVNVVGFCTMLSGRPFIQDVRGLETAVDVFF